MIQRSFTTQSLYTVNFQIYFKLSAFSSSYPQVWWTFWSSGIALLPIWDVCVRIQRNPMIGKTLAMLVERSLFKCMAITVAASRHWLRQLRLAYLSIILHMWLYRSLQVFQRSNSQVGHRVLSDFTLQMSDQIVRQNPPRSEWESPLSDS